MVSGEVAARLRGAGGDHHDGVQRTERVHVHRRAQRLHGLREDVEAQGVVRHHAAHRDVEAAVAYRAPEFEGVDGEPRRTRERLDARALRRNADPRVARAHQVLAGLEPVVVHVVLRGDVLPLGDHGAVEGGGRGRAAHHDPGLVGETTGGDRRGPQPDPAVGARVAGDEVLLFHVAARGEVERSGEEGVVARRVPGHRRGDRPGHVRDRNWRRSAGQRWRGREGHGQRRRAGGGRQESADRRSHRCCLPEGLLFCSAACEAPSSLTLVTSDSTTDSSCTRVPADSRCDRRPASF